MPAVAIVGYAARFPGAPDVATYWDNLCRGVESIAFFDERELVAAGVPRSLVRHPSYVPAAPILADIAAFDAAFFRYSPREARVMDPQHRIFLEVAWEAMEHAGFTGERGRPVGVFVGSGGSTTTYLMGTASSELRGSTGSVQHLGNDRDFFATRASFQLNLTGPSVTVQTACSTSLVAVHMACQAILAGECDMALAGGVNVRVPHRAGYLFEDGGILSPDGHCRPFDARAQGTIFGSGAGVVVLKRLDDALADRDAIRAVILGSATNNDGAGKLSYAASSADGITRVVSEALGVARVDADTVGYVEAHGTATTLGDPVEVSALTRAFRRQTARTGYCKLGSVKGNIGHLEQAAGVASLIKAALVVEHGLIPPSLHFERPNPRLGLERTPFAVVTELARWDSPGAPRRAAVSSLGLGGTNAHLLLEQPPRRQDGAASQPSATPYVVRDAVEPAARTELFVLSARAPGALTDVARRLRGAMAPCLRDLAYSLATTRVHHEHRIAITAASSDELASALEAIGRGETPRGAAHGQVGAARGKLAWLFTGQGAQRLGMGRGLYARWPVFRDALDAAFAAFAAAS
ncbi:MAG TPA: type I polyketide synthase, partial [Kofleriaceae bacterium]|nr:type I polyketide synthase [Kofleriaceae bacterium]